MDKLFMDPLVVDDTLRGQMSQCVKCKKESVFEYGVTYEAYISKEDGVHLFYLWFCSLKCLLTSLTRGKA